MEIAEEEFTVSEPDMDAILKEAWPLPEEDTLREFEQYLADIGVRF